MDKLKPTYNLDDIKRLVTQDDGCMLSIKAKQTAHGLGFSETQAKESLLLLERNDFYKSTNENFNPKVWQDVYCKQIKGHNVYIKLKIIQKDDQFLIVTSFKKDTSAESGL